MTNASVYTRRGRARHQILMTDDRISDRLLQWLISRAAGRVLVIDSPGVAKVLTAEGFQVNNATLESIEDIAPASFDSAIVVAGLEDRRRLDRPIHELLATLKPEGMLLSLIHPRVADSRSGALTAVTAVTQLSEVTEIAVVDDVIAVSSRAGETPATALLDYLSEIAVPIDRIHAETSAQSTVLAAEIDQARDQANALYTALTAAEVRLETVFDEYEQLGHQANTMAVQLEELTTAAGQRTGELTATTKRVELLEEKLAAAQAEASNLSSTLSDERRKSSDERRKSSEALSRVESRLGSLQEDLDRSKRYSNALKAEKRDLEQRALELLEAIAKYRNRIDRQHMAKTDLQNQLASIRYEHRKLSHRKWWRIYTILRSDARRPWRWLLTPIRIARVLVSDPYQEPPPTPQPVVPAFPQEEARPDASAAPAAQTRDKKPAATTSRTPRAAHEKLLSPDPSPSLEALRVAAILDEMSRASFEPECELITFRPDNWQQILSERQPHLLLVESAWQGNGGSWQYQVGTYALAESLGLPHLSRLVSWCRSRGIPTVFWNKEDPVHFDKFKEAASLFDTVFTTDGNIIDRYTSLSGSAITHCAALPFAAQPELHNPIGSSKRKPAACFAGTFYRNRHLERQGQLEMLLDAALPFGLTIFDRMHGSESDAFGFPDRFHGCIRGGVPYYEMVNLYRQFRVFLNTNSVTDSPTMFSRRVFELLACGTPVISTPSDGVEALFGDLVSIVADADGAREALESLMTDDALWRQRSTRGIERVMLHHTYAHRLATVADQAGYHTRVPLPTYAMLVDSSVSDDPIRGDASVRSLSLPPRHVVVPYSDKTATEPSSEVRLISAEPDLMSKATAAAGVTDADYLLVAEPGQTGVEALLAAAVYSRADVIGFANDDAEPYSFTDEISPKPLLVSRRALSEGRQLDLRDLSATRSRGGHVFAVPRVDAV